ncbi:MAG: Rid family detoxifying hydrolase [Thermodesulfovibrionia bacterium]
MADKKIFYSDKAPKPKGPYSQAVIYNGLLYISGQVPLDPETGLMVRATIEEETDVVMNNIRTIVTGAGTRMEDILKITCYLADIDDYVRFNEAYKKYFPQDPPARTMLQAGKLPLDVQVEIDAIVALPITNTEYNT